MAQSTFCECIEFSLLHRRDVLSKIDMGMDPVLSVSVASRTCFLVLFLPLPSDLLYGPLQNRIKIIKKDFTYWLSNRLLVLAKFLTLLRANVTNLGSGSGASYITIHIAISLAVARYGKTGKLPGSLEICAPSPPPFCSAYSPVGL